MSSIENFKRNLPVLMEERGLNDRSLALRVGHNPTLIRDIKSGKVAQPRKETRLKIARGLGVSLDDMESDNLEPSDYFEIELDQGVSAHIQTPMSFKDAGFRVQDLLVTVSIDHQPETLFTISRVGNAMVLTPTDPAGFKGNPIPYEPVAEWYNGKVAEEDQDSSARITGVVRSLTIPCNSHLGQ